MARPCPETEDGFRWARDVPSGWQDPLCQERFPLSHLPHCERGNVPSKFTSDMSIKRNGKRWNQKGEKDREWTCTEMHLRERLER